MRGNKTALDLTDQMNSDEKPSWDVYYRIEVSVCVLARRYSGHTHWDKCYVAAMQQSAEPYFWTPRWPSFGAHFLTHFLGTWSGWLTVSGAEKVTKNRVRNQAKN